MNTKLAQEDVAAQFNRLTGLLRELIDSSTLDLAVEASDCIETFQDYNWEMKAGCDAQRFESLKQKATQGNISEQQLYQFMDMVSSEGPYHLYYVLLEARKALDEAPHPLVLSNSE